MTDIKNHVVSLEIANQLKEAGWVKETEFYWTYSMMDEPKIEHNPQPFRNCLESWTVLPAPLATEILEELPEKISLCAFYAKSEYRAVDNDVHRNASTQVSHNPCNALASMWLYLKKKKLI